MVVVPGRTSDPLESTKYHACHANHTGRAAATQLVAGGVWLVVGGWRWLVGCWLVVGGWLVGGWYWSFEFHAVPESRFELSFEHSRYPW